MRYVVVFLLGLLPANLSGQVTASAASPQQAPFFFALSVPDAQASARWYEENLGLKAYKSTNFEGGRVVLMRSETLRVELLELRKAVDPRAKIPEVKGPEGIYGIFKVGFYVPDLDATAKRLKDRGVHFELEKGSDADSRFVIVRDNSGNLLQLFESERQEQKMK